MAKRWSEADLEKLTKLSVSKGVDELSRFFQTEKSEIEEKLTELGLDFSTRLSLEDDPGLPFFAEALEPLHQKDWEKAKGLFEKAVATTDRTQLAERARQYIAICDRHISGDGNTDPYLQAVFEKNRGDLERALELCQENGDASADERYAYLLASIQALQGSKEESLENLATAIRLEPKNRVHAYHDPDFESLHGQEEFSQLIAPPAPVPASA